MACEWSADKELDDMTECSICTEVFTDPRVLPCIHTFCLKCLLNYGKDKQPGDDMPCPLCREDFTIPDDGLSGMHKNFFMEKLLHVRKLSAGRAAQRISCDICSSDEESVDESGKSASMYCVQCGQNYCDQCSQYHRKMKSSSSHTLVDIGKESESAELISKISPTMCEQHKSEEIKVFCQECRVAICMMCFIKSHKAHDCSDIDEVSYDFRKVAMSDIDKVTDFLKKTEESLPFLEKRRNELIKHFASVADEINTTADELIAAVELDRQKLLSEVESIKIKQVKQLEMVKQEVEQHMAALESFKRYSETLLSSGTACDVTRSANSLHDRAGELLMFDIHDHVNTSLLVTFISAKLLDGDYRNLVGTVTDEDSNSGTSTVTRVITTGNRVGGVASVGNDVFVVHISTLQEVRVYDSVTSRLQRRIRVPGLTHAYDLAVCTINQCLYVPDQDNGVIHRVELSGLNAVTKWSVDRHPAGVSVNTEHNLLVVSVSECRLQVFTTHGTLLQHITLPVDIDGPRYAIQLPNNQLVVSNVNSISAQLCLVGMYGQLLSVYEEKRSSVGKMRAPRGIAVDRRSNILLADMSNNRLLVFDQSLSRAQVMSVYVEGGLNSPRSLWYDQLQGRLFIGECDEEGRVIVIDNVSDFFSACTS